MSDENNIGRWQHMIPEAGHAGFTRCEFSSDPDLYPDDAGPDADWPSTDRGWIPIENFCEEDLDKEFSQRDGAEGNADEDEVSWSEYLTEVLGDEEDSDEDDSDEEDSDDEELDEDDVFPLDEGATWFGIQSNIGRESEPNRNQRVQYTRHAKIAQLRVYRTAQAGSGCVERSRNGRTSSGVRRRRFYESPGLGYGHRHERAPGVPVYDLVMDEESGMQRKRWIRM